MTRIPDAFDEDVAAINTPIWVRTPTDCEPELFFDGDRFMSYISKEYDFFDVITYSNSKSADAPLHKIRRLITNLPIPRRSGLRPQELRVVPNNHAKVFYCYLNPDALQVVYVGSQNLSHGLQINIMYRVDYRYNKTFIKFFNSLWKQALTTDGRILN